VVRDFGALLCQALKPGVVRNRDFEMVGREDHAQAASVLICPDSLFVDHVATSVSLTHGKNRRQVPARITRIEKHLAATRY
jgi:hypothetical protein